LSFRTVASLSLALFACLFLSPATAADPGAETDDPPPLSAYGALPSLELMQLSPSGQKMAFITVIGETRALAVIDLVNDRSMGGANVSESKVRDLQWIGDERVLVITSSTETLPEVGIYRRELYVGQVFDPARTRINNLIRGASGLFPALMSGVEVIRGGDRADVLVRAWSFNDSNGLNLYRVDPVSGDTRRAESMDRDVEDYVLDTSGRSVARSDYDERTRLWSLLLRRGDRFQETWSVTAPVDTPTLIGLGLTGDSVIVAADRPDLKRDDREEADYYDVNLETGAWRAVRFDFDPTGLLFHPVTGRLMGATRLDDAGRRYAFADDNAGVLWATVEKTFSGRAPSLVSWSDDLKTAVIFTSGVGDAGTYHFIDLKTGSTSPIGAAYGAVPADRVAPMTPVSYTAADGLEIHGYLTVPVGREAGNLPLIVLAHGGPASRDTLEFDWWAQALASRGYAVLQANFRGSTGYGEGFLEAGYGEWGRKMQTDLSDGVRWLAEQGKINPARVCIVGASYGGYAALAGATLDRGVYRCAVSVAGVSDLRRMVTYEAGRGEQRDNETVRYWNRFMGGDGPGDLSLDARSPARLADQVEAPVLLIHGRDDTVVPIEQSRIMAAALRRAGKPVEMIELNGEDHWLSRADTRIRMLTETVRFLEANNPPR
jgi:dipeptidyl aminopeptidase/acylaminoacyl peptidase